MKTHVKFFRMFLFMALLMSASVSMAQMNQNPTQTVCIGNEPYRVDLNALPGATYTWSIAPGLAGTDWQINPVAGPGNEITVDWLVAGVYTLTVITSANGCDGPPQSVVVTVNPLTPLSVTIATTDPTTICEGSIVTFTATVMPAGANPTYQWMEGGVPIAGATNATYAYTGVVPGAAITCQVASTEPCISGSPALSNQIDVTVNAQLPLSVTITTTDPTTICEGLVVNFTANVTNGGASPTFQWYLDGNPIAGATTNTYAYTGVVPGGSITCVVTAVEPCITGSPATSNAIAVTVNPVPVTTPIWHN